MSKIFSWASIEATSAPGKLARKEVEQWTQNTQTRVVLYRDRFGWCPYCHKVWLWLEEKGVDYSVRKVSMFCYGQKEAWYTAKFPRGMLPALELDGALLTESDSILVALESAFGSNIHPVSDTESPRDKHEYTLDSTTLQPLRRLERRFFSAWCAWLCRPQDSSNSAKLGFLNCLRDIDNALSATPGPYFLASFSVMDIIFAPFLERAHASIYYYKGVDIYSPTLNFPYLYAWQVAMTSRKSVGSIRADFHTHVHDLPPQLGGCFPSGDQVQQECARKVDKGPWITLPDFVDYTNWQELRVEALYRVWKHREAIKFVNPDKATDRFDIALRCTLTNMMNAPYLLYSFGAAGNETLIKPPEGSAIGIRHLRNQICVPRDMSIGAANLLRQALEATAALDGDAEPLALPTSHRRDQDATPFSSPNL
ncbi:hypothetical protein HK100_007448 [Physocladia obscura]|uniref:GST N-terminal domain-containing protein n=1 Tax=Physocladia obscura TaxID=109957 RepID=A0AAD5XC43_9FUNG|nr:hypothetical protein HK100_007448 [Physocladia obscura]